MKKVILLLALTSTLVLQSCTSIFTSEPKYVRVRGTQFELGGKPYYFVGTNFWYGCYLGAPGELGNRERLIRELDNLKALGITNLRVLAGSEASYINKTLEPPIQPEPGVYNEQILEGLDFLLAEMRKREMHAVVFLNNYWEWSGGFAVYNKWHGSGETVDPNNPQQGWDMFMNYSAKFYTNEKGNELFRKFILKIVTRKNKFTGDFYWQDPAIMSWQLANEPRPGNGEAAIPNQFVYYKWIDETAKYIKSLDPNHLVTTGSEGLAGSLDIDSIYIKAHQSKYIDYSTFHLWVKNWRWYDAQRAEETFPTTLTKAFDYFNKHMKYARILGKPVTMEEFGLGRDLESCDLNSLTTYRDKYFKMLFDAVQDSARAGAPIAGTNFWGWGGEGRGKNKDEVWRAGDPFVGDPPQEPQGLNSIFDSDQLTIKIIKQHGEQMFKLREDDFLIKK